MNYEDMNKEELIKILRETRKEMEESRKKITMEMKGRRKEFDCLYAISGIIEGKAITEEELYRKIIKLIPPAFIYPEITCTRLIIETVEFKTENFMETEWKLSEDILFHSKKIGLLEVFYTEEKHVLFEGPFLEEEKNLINIIAERLGRVIERLRTEESLRESEEIAKALMNCPADSVILMDTEGYIINLNENAAQRLGKTINELHGKRMDEFLLPDIWEKRRLKLQEVIKSGKPLRFEDERLGLWFDHIIYPVFDSHGKVIKVAISARDITDIKKMSLSLKLKDHAISSSINGITFADIKGNLIYANRAFVNMWGYDDEKEIAGKHVSEFWQRNEESDEIIELVINKGKWTGERIGRRKDGSLFYTIFSGNRILDENDRLICMQASVIDITERKKAEEALKKSEEKFRTIMELSPDMIIILDATGNLVYYSPAARRILGYSQDDMIGKKTFSFIHPDDRSSFSELFTKLLTEPDELQTITHRRLCKDGSYKWLEALASNQIKNPLISGIIVISRDITYRKLIEDSLRESEDRLRTLINAMPDIVCFKDGEGRWLEANEYDLNLFHLTGVDYKGKKDSELACYSSFYREAFLFCEETDEKSWQSRDYSRCVEAIPMPDGEALTFDVIKVPTFHPDGSRKGLIVVGRDITELKKTEEALKNSEFELSIKNHIARIFLTVDDDSIYREVLEILLKVMESNYGIFGFINEAGELNCPSLSKNITNKTIVFPEETWNSIRRRVIIEGKSFYSNVNLSAPKGHIPVTRALSVPIVYHGEVTGLFTVANKMTDYNERDRMLLESIGDFVSPILHARLQRDRFEAERNRLEGQLRQSQKMEAIGTLAGGIAHDFNNILGAILGYTDLTLMELPEDSEAYQNLEKSMTACIRARDLVKQILNVGSKSEEERKLLHFNLIIKEALNLLRASLPSTIEIKSDIDEKSFVVMANPTHIHQIIMNLCTNSAHAMKERGGLLEVSLNNITITQEEANLYELQPGPYVKLSVKDTGYGINREVMERIFEPYFTTKKHGEGSGLGLAVVHGIVKSYGGEIKVSSEPGKGSTFYIYFPAVKSDMADESKDKIPLPLGNERILIVDDEELLVSVMKKMLEKLGYKVTAGKNSSDILEIFRRDPYNFDLVITDQTMPHMTGIELAKELLLIRSDMPVILCSGHSDIINSEKARETGIRETIRKPLNLYDIATVVDKVLRGKG